jgi:hypothetical protein
MNHIACHARDFVIREGWRPISENAQIAQSRS